MRRETGSIACHGAPGVSNTAGAALWVVDYTLQAATLGITELYFHEGVGYKYNFVSFQLLSLAAYQRTHVEPDTTYISEPVHCGRITSRSAAAAAYSAEFLCSPPR